MVSIWQGGCGGRLAPPPGMVETFQGVVGTVLLEGRRRGMKEKVIEGEIKTLQSLCHREHAQEFSPPRALFM